VVFVGPVGVGKSMLAQCLGSASVRAGHSVLFIRADALLAELGQARADRSYDKVFRRYLAPDLVILDDFGLRRLTAHQSNDLYELIVERHRGASFAITSNRSVDEWLGLFDDPILGNSALDRLANAAHQIVIEGPSYRAKLARGVAQGESGRRGARHAVANCGVAALILLVAGGSRDPLPAAVLAAVAGSFAAALADTLGTEVGSLAGRRPVSLLSLAPVPPGTPGAVSLAGTAAGAAGALLVGALAWALGMVSPALVPAIGLAGVAGSLAESALADLSRRRGFRVDHEFANALNTFVGAAVAAEIALSLAKGGLYVPFEN